MDFAGNARTSACLNQGKLFEAMASRIATVKWKTNSRIPRRGNLKNRRDESYVRLKKLRTLRRFNFSITITITLFLFLRRTRYESFAEVDLGVKRCVTGLSFVANSNR